MEPESKEYSWAWLIANRLLSHGPCELVYVYMTPSGAETGTIIYNGQGTTGDVVVTLVAVVATGHKFAPRKPVYCDKGLYVVKGSATTGVFVMWREL